MSDKQTVGLVCRGYWLGHEWSDIPPKPGFATWCVRCHVHHPRFNNFRTDLDWYPKENRNE